MRPNEREMYRYRTITPFISLSKTFRTRQVTVTSTASIAINTLRPMLYMIQNLDSVETIFIGNDGVTISSGYPIAAEERLIFSMTENSRLYAITDTVSLTLYILEMGI